MLNSVKRQGAVAPLFALLLPILFLMASFAINVAYMQLTTTELKIATDATAHAAGRAMSIYQTTEDAVATARTVAQYNHVAGQELSLTIVDSDDDITFGQSIRANNGLGRYEFTPWEQSQVDSGERRATSIAIEVGLEVPLMFFPIEGVADTVTIRKRSIATQVDRDIALVLDRSGSMLMYENETALAAALLELYETYETTEIEGSGTDGFYRYAWYDSVYYGWQFLGYASFDEASDYGWYWYAPWDYYWVEGTPPQTESTRLISYDEYQDATQDLYDRRYSDNVIAQLATISQEMSEYAQGWMDMINSSNSWDTRSPAPPHSRWAFLVDGVDAFLNVLEGTDQIELVTLVTFNNQANLDLTLQSDYSGIRSAVASILPYNGTAIGDGMLTGAPELMDGTEARIFAAKTIVVLSDGESNSGTDPLVAANSIVADDAITIHTVTFATDNETAKSDMDDVATAGSGVHYHADTGQELIDTFEEIANNLPTILSE